MLHHAARHIREEVDGIFDDMVFVIQQKSIANRERLPYGKAATHKKMIFTTSSFPYIHRSSQSKTGNV